MSDVKKRLNLLRKKKTGKKSLIEPGDKSPSSNETVPADHTHQIPDPPVESRLDDSKKATLDKLRSLITRVETKKPDNNSDILQQLNRKPLLNREPVRDYTPPAGNGILEDDLFEGPGQNIEDLIPGEYLDTPHGPCFRVKTEYPWQYHQGNMPVSTLPELSPASLKEVTGDETLARMDFHNTLFFDTETTGLDTGAGVYIFLAGLGYYENRSFIVEQYFMRDFPEEPAVLHSLHQLMSRFTYLVTYNGKTYDWPLLESRFAMNRRQPPMDNPPHLDLLHASRRLYRFRLENCKLPSVEAGVINFLRMDDMPGALLPERYFRYVRSRDARFIHKAFSHNAHDIVSMAAILAAMIQFLDDPVARGVHPVEDVYALGRLREQAGDFAGADEAFTSALQQGLTPELYPDALQRLSLVLKRQNEWDRACEIWRNMVQTLPGKCGIFPHIELAKYFEHQLKDFTEAKNWVLAANEELPRCWPSPVGARADLEHRLRRIEAKAAGKSWRQAD